jgi:hypothetical protein
LENGKTLIDEKGTDNSSKVLAVEKSTEAMYIVACREHAAASSLWRRLSRAENWIAGIGTIRKWTEFRP